MSELGSKQTCPGTGCGVKFYDLGKKPAECPKCGKKFDASALSVGRRPQKAKPLKAVKPPKKAIALEAEDEDLDLSGFETPDDVAGDDTIESLDEIDELEEGIDALTEVGEREREEDLLNSDDADDDSFIEEMDKVETIVDRPDEVDEEVDEEK